MSTGERIEKDNSTPLRKNELRDATVVQAVQSQSQDDSTSSHPQANPADSVEEVKRANATAGGPLYAEGLAGKSDSGQTLKEEEKTDSQFETGKQ